jgi:uncharacterized protein YecT (DUF1311 family)
MPPNVRAENSEVIMRSAALAPLLATCAPALCLAAGDDPAETSCHQKNGTIDISDCLQGLTARWDKRLNTAYQAASKASKSAARKTALLHAEKAWLKFRTANCGWYDTQEGTIREIEAADYMLDMTRNRAVELEQALRQRPAG